MNAVIKKTAKKKAAGRKSPARKKTSGARDATKKSPVNKASKKRPTSSRNNNIVLAPVLMINDAKNLYVSLNKVISNNKDMRLDASSVEMIDTAMMQLLLSFHEKLKTLNIKCTWIKPSAVFLNRAEALNVTEQLGLENVVHQ